MKPILAWHFTGEKLRDGRPIPTIGEVLHHEGPLVLCESGLHASRNILHALEYAPGPLLHRVKCGGEIIKDYDKLVCSERAILWTIDAKKILRKFACLCALDVACMWNMPDIVRLYLKTCDEGLRDAARAAAGAAAWVVAEGAARDAARAAAWDAAWDAAKDAACAAAWVAPQAVAKDAAWVAARKKQKRRLLRMINAERKKQK